MKKILTILFLFLSVSITFASKPYVVNLYRENYGADNKNWAIDEDERGVLYFANDGGLLQYDVIEWVLNKMTNSPTVRSLAVKSHQTIFTGGYEEFGRWDRSLSGELIYTSLSDQVDKSLFVNDDFWKIWVDADYVYFQSFNSIFVYDYENIIQIKSDTGFLFLSKVRNEYYVQKMHGSLFKLSGTSLIKIEGSEFLKGSDVRVILPFKEDQLLIGTASHGLYSYDGHQFSEWNKELSDIINAKELNCGLYTHSDTYMLGTILGGIIEVNSSGEILTSLSSDNSLQNNTILSLYEDRRKNIWVAMDRGLAAIHYTNKIDFYTNIFGHAPTVYDCKIWNDKLFFATNQGVFYLDRKDILSPSALNLLRFIEGTQGQVWNLCEIKGDLYCCHNHGLMKINANLTVHKIKAINIGVYDINKLNIYNQETFLLSTYYSVKFLHLGANKIYDSEYIKEPILSALNDHLDNVWLEHFNKGVYRCRISHDLKEIEYYRYYGGDSGDGLPYKLKLFKLGGRVMLYGDNCFFTYDDLNDSILPSTILNKCFHSIEGIKNIIPGFNNEFWALGKNSIYKFTFDGYKAEIVESYTFQSNISLVNNYENASYIDRNNLLICLDNGFAIYKESIDHHNDETLVLTSPFLSTVESSNIQGEKKYYEIEKFGTIEKKISHRVSFSFTSADVFSSNVNFQYKLEGVDLYWSNGERVNHVSYDRLPVGLYTFKLRTKNTLGVISAETEYQFEILPPWYLTSWAYFMYFVLFILIAYVIWILILRRYKVIHLRKIRAHETQRLKLLATELKDKLEVKNAEMLTQTSFLIQKNELITEVKNIINDFRKMPKSKELTQMIRKIDILLSTIDSEADWKLFIIAFEEKHTDFFKKLKILYPELTANDLRLCACLRLNLESKEIASLMNLSIRAVENNRYRIRKKLKLKSSQNLNEFIISI